jgi:hypothetical protein
MEGMATQFLESQANTVSADMFGADGFLREAVNQR